MKNQKLKNNGLAVRADARLEVRAAAKEGDEATVAVTFSSEDPYLRDYFWDAEKREYITAYEVLGHKADEIDDSRMKDGLVIQDTHWGDQIGIIDEVTLKDGKLGGVVRFGCGQRAQEIKRDALAGIRRNMSVGYMVNAYEKTNETIDGVPVVRVTKWTPYEASFVNTPADTTVGVGRKDFNVDEVRAEVATEAPAKNEPATVAVAQKEESTMDPKIVAELIGQATRAGIADKVVAALGEGKTEAEARSMIADAAFKMADEAKAQKVREISDGEAAREMKKRGYSLLNAVKAAAGDKMVDAGFEREVGEEIARKMGKAARGVYIPTSAFVRAVTGTGTPAFGSNTIETEILSNEYAAALLGETVLGAAGVRTLSGLTGNIAIPKGSALSYAWVTEGNAAAQTNAMFPQIPGTPKTISGNVTVTRKLLAQSSLDVEALIKNDLLAALAVGVEAAAFSGKGTANDPVGLDNTTGVQAASLTADAVTKKELCDMVALIQRAKVAGELKFIAAPEVMALLESTAVKVGSMGVGFLAEGGKINGRAAFVSVLSTVKKLYLGKWDEMLLATWGGVDLVVDPYSESTSGNVRLSAFQDVDILVRRPEAFAVGTALS